MKTKYRLLILLISFFALSCDDLVDVTPKGFVIPETAEHLRLLLNNVETGFFEKRPITIGYDLINFAGDQAFFVDADNLENGSGQDAYAYYMRDQRLIEKNNYGAISQLYQLVSLANVVLDIFPTTTDLSDTERNQIKGEALVHRAYAYLIMVNTHGRHYDPTTSATDPGVPMPLVHNINVESMPRSTVKEVYDQILTDLHEAENLLGNANTNRATPCKASVFSLLSRTYLYMGNFDLALEYSEKALDDIDFLYNYEDYYDGRKLSLPLRRWNNEETMLFKWCHNDYNSSASRYISYDFYKLHDKKDLRLKLYTQNLGRYKFTYDTKAFTGVLSSEMYLTKAECLARNNQLDSALAIVNKIRQHRFKAEDFTPIYVSTQDSVIDVVFTERQIELAWTGLRWYDMKRLNKEAKYAKTLTRTYKEETLIFEPNSDLWVFPFPSEILIDGVIEQNP